MSRNQRNLRMLGGILAAVLLLSCGIHSSRSAVQAGTPFAGPMQASVSSEVEFFAAALSEFLSDSREFTASVSLRLPGLEGQAAPMAMAMSEGRIRLQRTGGGGDPFSGAAIVLEERKPMIVMLSSMKAWTEVPLEEIGALVEGGADKLAALERKLVGEEKVGEYETLKYLIHSKDEEDQGRQALVWKATRLAEMPIQFMMKEKDGRIRGVRLSNIVMKKPAETLFSPPEGWRKVESMNQLVQELMVQQLKQTGQ